MLFRQDLQGRLSPNAGLTGDFLTHSLRCSPAANQLWGLTSRLQVLGPKASCFPSREGQTQILVGAALAKWLQFKLPPGGPSESESEAHPRPLSKQLLYKELKS